MVGRPPLRISVLQHVSFEGPAAVGHWFQSRGHRLTAHRLWLGDPPPAPGEADVLVAMGGPMGVHDTSSHPWLRRELETIGEAIESGTPVLGICLGAQLIASALGARVYRAREPEIGWWPVEFAHPPADPAWDAWIRVLPARATVMQWHGETFDLPDRAVRLARSVVCPNQGFVYGANVVALQFHLEATAQSVVALTEAAADATGGGTYEPTRPHAMREMCRGELRSGGAARALLAPLLEALERCARSRALLDSQ